VPPPDEFEKRLGRQMLLRGQKRLQNMNALGASPQSAVDQVLIQNVLFLFKHMHSRSIHNETYYH
jgi:hypothetical protein